MCKSEIFAEILNIVGKETEVSTELILSSSKVTEVVDARSIVVFFLTEYGLYPEQIATLLHKTSASIRYLISTFESRKLANKMIAYICKIFANRLKMSSDLPYFYYILL